MPKSNAPPVVAGLVLAAGLLVLMLGHVLLLEDAMTAPWLLVGAGALAWLGAAILIWSWCAAAGIADERMEAERRAEATRARLLKLCPPEDDDRTAA